MAINVGNLWAFAVRRLGSNNNLGSMLLLRIHQN